MVGRGEREGRGGGAMLARAPCTTCQGREELRGGGGVEQLPQLHAARIEGGAYR